MSGRKLANLDSLKSGDLVEVELEIDSKNDYEYVLFEDLKAAGFEPIEVRSGYNGNSFGAYVELRDNRATFFIRHFARQTLRALPLGPKSPANSAPCRQSPAQCTPRN